MSSFALACIAVIGLSGLIPAFLLAQRWQAWRRGRHDAPVDLRKLAQVPRRYLVDVHAVVARRPANARMHVQAAGGLLGTALLATGALLGLVTGAVGAAVIVLLALAGLSGAALDAARRWPERPPHLSGGRFRLLPPALAGANLFFLLAGSLAALDAAPPPASPVGAALLVLGILSLGALSREAGRGPMRHALAGALHLAFHPRPARFAGLPATALKPARLGSERLGADRVEDLGWNQLLGLDACVQCGRCEEACPAFAAGQPLNPKKLVNDIAGACAPVHYAGSPHPGLPATASRPGQLLIGPGGALAPETLWACTTCRACVSACPMMIEHVDAIVDLRRFATLELGSTPGKAPALLAAIEETDTLCGRHPAARLDFATDLGIPRIVPGRAVEVLLWIGEGGFELRNQRSLRALIGLLREAEVDFAVLDEEPDCGDTARRLGDEIAFTRLATSIVDRLSGLSFDRIVTADPHAAHSLLRDYPAFGGHYRVSHHAGFLDELVASSRLRLPATVATERITYHDPCYLGRYLGEFDAPRRLLDRLGADRIEMPRHARTSFCCGGGGGAAVTDVPGRVRIPDLRMEEARRTGAETVVVACPTCTIMLEGVAQPRPAVREIAEFLLAAVRAEGRA